MGTDKFPSRLPFSTANIGFYSGTGRILLHPNLDYNNVIELGVLRNE